MRLLPVLWGKVKIINSVPERLRGRGILVAQGILATQSGGYEWEASHFSQLKRRSCNDEPFNKETMIQ